MVYRIGRISTSVSGSHVLMSIGLLLSLMLAFFSQPQPASANLVLNGDFEAGITGWTGGAEDGSFFHWGKKSLRVEDRSTTAWISAYTTNSIPISPEKRYLLEVWVRGVSANVRVEVGIQQFDSKDNWISDNNKVTDVIVGTQWIPVQVLLADFNPLATAIRIFLSPTDWTAKKELIGTAYFDDVRFIPYSGNLVENGDFETGLTGWSGNTSLSTPTTNPHSGKASLKVADNSTAKPALAAYSNSYIPVFSDMTYFLETWLRGTVNNQEVWVTLGQYTFDANGNYARIKNKDYKVRLGTSWQRFIMVVDDLEPDTQWVNITLWPTPWTDDGINTGIAYVDDIRFQLYNGNLITNSSFEYGDAGWTGEGYKIVDTYKNSGSFSLHITDSSATKNILVWTQDLIPVSLDSIYLLQAWVRGKEDGQGVFISVSQFDENRQWIYGNNIDSKVIASTAGTSFRKVIR
ncbi:MAG: hypothetical protein A2Z14_03340 [Chloroflexi bacterium RBG_16_48_8]|nr:MAG: hypothetical protein A2Z14_03340 [Chloroflexi bacterium RBG_16_48_8]